MPQVERKAIALLSQDFSYFLSFKFLKNSTSQWQTSMWAMSLNCTFQACAKTAVIFKELRLLLDNLLERKLASPGLKLKGSVK